MALRKRLTHGQYFFLQTIRRHPEGVPMLHWPRAATMRRWLRTPLFLRAMLTLRESMRFEADLILAGTAMRSAKLLAGMLDKYNCDEKRYDLDKRMASLVRVLRAEHIRQRETKPRANEHVARKAEALAAVRDATVARQTTPVIDDPGPHATDPTPQLSATAGKMLIDVWGSLDRLLAEQALGDAAEQPGHDLQQPDENLVGAEESDGGAKAASD
jgi:hypothetical protein